MSTPINGGGPAFPVTLDHRGCVGAYGMSLRQHFAGLAMAAILGREDTFANSDRSEAGFPDSAERLWREVAKAAFQQADAMISEGATK